MGAATKRHGLDGLGVPEKVDLINELWNEVVSSSEAVPFDEELGNELERRLAAYRADPSIAVTPEASSERESAVDDTAVQTQLRARAMRCAGSVRGDDPERAENASERVRDILKRKRAG